MISLKVGGLLLAAFIAGAFVASPELRAYAADTVFSSDIVDGEVKTVDLADSSVTTSKIKDSSVQRTDLQTGSVTSAKIADGSIALADMGPDSVDSTKIIDGTITYADFSRSSVVVEHRDDCNCGGTGWDPDGSESFALVYDDAVNPNSVVSVSYTGSYVLNCFATRALDGYFIIQCNSNIPNGVDLNYAVFNHP